MTAEVTTEACGLKGSSEAKASGKALVLLSTELTPISVSREAMRILAYPTHPETLRDGLAYVRDRITQSLLRQKNPPVFAEEYTSGRRSYTCRSFSLLNQSNGILRPAIAVLLERRFTGINPLVSQFNLTSREGEVVELLGWGLTTKEIAQRMKISGSTVNSFVRIVMIKMGVSTRSGIVGKVWQQHAASRL